MLCVLIISILCLDSIFSIEITELSKIANHKDESTRIVDSGTPREKRQFAQVASVIPDEVKDEFKEYAKSYLNSVVTQMSKKSKLEENENSKRARICAEVCQHRCLPSCEWSCCIKENIEEYRSAHLVKPLVEKLERKSHLTKTEENAKNRLGKKRAHFVRLREHEAEALKDGSECHPSCKRYCLPSCRFACCQPVQVKGVLLF